MPKLMNHLKSWIVMVTKVITVQSSAWVTNTNRSSARAQNLHWPRSKRPRNLIFRPYMSISETPRTILRPTEVPLLQNPETCKENRDPRTETIGQKQQILTCTAMYKPGILNDSNIISKGNKNNTKKLDTERQYIHCARVWLRFCFVFS